MLLFLTALLLCFLACSPVCPFELPADHILWGEQGPPRGNGTVLHSRVAASPEPTRVDDAVCTHGPHTRPCWANGFSVATDFDQKWPDTKRVVKYTLEIANETCNPDGWGERSCQLFNGQYPGPLIEAGMLPRAPRSCRCLMALPSRLGRYSASDRQELAEDQRDGSALAR